MEEEIRLLSNLTLEELKNDVIDYETIKTILEEELKCAVCQEVMNNPA